MSRTLELHVTGMTCGGCEQAVRRALERLQGIEHVAASHADNRVHVTFDAAQVDEAAVKSRIEALGYQVEG